MALITSDRARFPNDPWQLVETVHLPAMPAPWRRSSALATGTWASAAPTGPPRTRNFPAASSTASTRPGTSSTRKMPSVSPAPGQRILYVPDANNFTVIIDGEPLSLANPRCWTTAVPWTSPPGSTNAGSPGSAVPALP